MNAERVRETPLRVVIIDDTEDLRELLRMALERGGIEVVGEAGDGRAGIDVVRADPPDVILLDLSMPVMDGLEALPHLREVAPEAQIVVLSGFDAGHMEQRATAMGAAGYLQKGMPLGRLLERVREFADVQTQPAPPALHVAPEPATSPEVDPNDLEPFAAAFVQAPFGVLVVEPADPHRLLLANPAAVAMLEAPARRGSPLAETSAEVARLLVGHLTTGHARFTADLGERKLRIRVRRTPELVVLYVEPASQEFDALRRVVATTAHEIRGPVTVLVALAETIEHHGDDMEPEERTRLLSSVARQAHVLDSITGDLLVSAQLDRGALRIRAEAVDPIPVIDTVLRDQGTTASLVVDPEVRLLVDPLRLEQMVGNLVRNAAKYGRPPITISVRGNAEDPRLVDVVVGDAGDGVPDGFRSQLFGEFARAPHATVDGVGLGLHVVRSLAEAQGGAVSYTPGDDGGSQFQISLPRA